MKSYYKRNEHESIQRYKKRGRKLQKKLLDQKQKQNSYENIATK